MPIRTEQEKQRQRIISGQLSRPSRFESLFFILIAETNRNPEKAMLPVLRKRNKVTLFYTLTESFYVRGLNNTQ